MMSIKFFGQYLLERNILSADQLLEAIRYQESRNMKFGEYAREKGFLNKEQVLKLNDEQKRNDMRMGELSVSLGMLTDEQVDEILTMQKNDHILIGEAIISKGFLTEETLDGYLETFKEDQSIYNIGDISVPDGVKNAQFVKVMVDLTLKMISRIVGVEAKSDGGTVLADDIPGTFTAISITFSGALTFDYVFMASESLSRKVAEAVIGDSVDDEEPAMIVDGVREFCNIICGNVLAKFAQAGKNVEISIPHTLSSSDGGYGIVAGSSLSVGYTLATTEGDFSLIISEL
jgi:CheY-specific phosphatase CheX